MKPLLVCLALFTLPALTGAQTPTRLIGRLVQTDGRTPIAGATVTLNGQRVVTNERGVYTIDSAPAGRHAIQFEMIGYLARTDTVNIAAGETSDLLATMTVKPVNLPPLNVSVRSRWLDSNGYYERRDRSGLSGRFIDRAELERKNPTMLTDVFNDISGAKSHTGFSRRVIRFNRPEMRSGVPVLMGGPGVTDPFERWLTKLPGCEPLFYVDGRAHSDRVISGHGQYVDDFNVVSPAIVEAIEVYVGANAPGQYRSNGCGVVLVWTRK